MNQKYQIQNYGKLNEYYEEDCDSLLAVNRILCRATKFKYVTIGKQDYLPIIPLNRKFNLTCF